jgi:hypothetical protein
MKFQFTSTYHKSHTVIIYFTNGCTINTGTHN